MDYHTLKNLAILGLVQVGAVVAIILGAGAAIKWNKENDYVTGAPVICTLLTDFGWLLLFLPLGWVGITCKVFQLSHCTDVHRWIAVMSGFVLLFGFIILGWYGALSPILRTTGCGLTIGP